MAQAKHLIIIHGRATKPSRKEKTRLIEESLLHGLQRNHPDAARKVKSGRIKLSIAYYGDISNSIMIDSGKKSASDLPGKDADHGHVPCEKEGSYDTDLARLFQRTSFNKRAYKEFLAAERDKRALDDIATALSGVMNILGLSDNVIRTATPDMGAYLTRHSIRSTIRERLNEHLLPALEKGDDICLVSHSMGCIVSYDVLWKYSHMSEYSHVRTKTVSQWITLGNPLGEPGVRNNLIDAPFEAEEDLYPTNIKHWLNIAAYDDFVSHDATMANDFKAMKRKRNIRGLQRSTVSSIKDARIYNFWAGYDGSNPHKLYGYLDHPRVAKAIAGWIG